MKHAIYFMLIFIILFKVKNEKAYCVNVSKKLFSPNVIQHDFHKKKYLLFITNKNNVIRKYFFKNEKIYNRKKKKEFSLLGRDNRNPYLAFEYVNRIIENKKYEVKQLLEEHCDENSPLQIRLKYLQHTMNNKLSDSLKRRNADEKHRLSVVADLKRKTIYRADMSQAIGEREKGKIQQNEYNPMRENSLLHLKNPGNAYMMLYNVGVDAVIVNTDYLSADGNISDLHDIVKISRNINRVKRPAIVFNDIIIHPIQIALAAENKADAVLLNFSFLREDVEEMLHYCINLGIEAIVEVHDCSEIYYATQYGACIIMINEYDLLNNIYEYNHAVKAINYVIPEIITIAKIEVNEKNNINYVEQLGGLCYDSICFENKLKDDDLAEFIPLCKNWSGPNKTLLHLNRNNYLKECLSYDENGIGSQKHKKVIETLQNMYGDKNVKNDYSQKLLENYEKETLFEENDQKSTLKGEEKKEKSENNLLNDEENKIVSNFRKEKKKELLFLNQLRDLVKEVDDHCRQNEKSENTITEEENTKKEERLESLLENFTNLDRSFLRQFFSDEEITNIENSIKQAIEQKKKINKNSSGNENNDMKENYETLNNFDIQNLVKQYFDYGKEDADNENGTSKLLDDTSDDFRRGVSSE